MKWPEFSNPKEQFIVVCFVQESDLASLTTDLEALGKQRNVKLIVQPCPYEGLEFLFQIDADLMGHLSSFDKELYWKALRINPKTPSDKVEKIAEHFHAYFIAILEQDDQRVRKEHMALTEYEEFFQETAASDS